MTHNLTTMIPRNKNLIINRVFIPGLLLLLLNDHFLKYYYSNWLTGKLSDFIGLLIFPLFLTYLFPRQAQALRRYNLRGDLVMPLLTGILFIFWKSPWSTPLITLFNKLSPLDITRTIDYSDLLALSVLPLSWYLIPRIDNYKIDLHRIGKGIQRRLNPLLLILPCSLVFMSTVVRYTHGRRVDGTIYIGRSFTLKMSQEQVLEAMRREGFHPLQDTSYHETPNPHYILENVAFSGTTDTVRSIWFNLHELRNDKTEFMVTYVNKKGDVHISDWRLLKLYSRYYHYLIKSRIIREIK